MHAVPRSPSPLRQSQSHPHLSSTAIDPQLDSDSDDDDDDDNDNDRELESTSSVSQFAANFAQKVGSFVGGMTTPSPSPSPHPMSSSEIEREAQRERERGRREAERILQAESQRSSLEDRVLAMLDSTRALPPPPSRSQTLPNPETTSQPSSPSWWTAAKNRLTPTKDKDLTPAQQVIQDVKRSEKEREKAEKEYQKELKRSSKGKDKDWPAVADNKYSDPSFLNLNVPQTPTPQHRRSGSPTSNSASSPGRVLGSPSASGSPARSFTAPNLTPSPNRSTASNASPGRADQPPIYAQFNAQGGLDVHLTLITIAKRFEKLEKWTVGHVRALEERMGDVERWLVDKEEREQQDRGSRIASKDDETVSKESASDSHPDVRDQVQNLRDEILELQGRIGELGREMAELSRERAIERVMPEKLSSSKQSQSAQVREASPPPTSSSFAAIESSVSPGSGDWPNLQPHKRVPSVRESTSPPLLRSLSRQTTGSRLPYPTGDYAPAPPEIGAVLSGTFSPPTSPPGSLSSRTPTRKLSSSQPLSGIGLGLATAGQSGAAPISSSASTYSTSYSNASFSSVSSISPSTSPSPSPGHRAQQKSEANASPSTAQRSSRVLPVPPKEGSTSSPSGNRKRYTVALGTPITRASAMMAETESTFVNGNNRNDHGSGLPRHGSNSSIGRAFFSSSPVSVGRADEVNDEDDLIGDETIGKSSSHRTGLAAALKDDGKGKDTQESDSFTPTHSRIRAQSAYGYSSIIQQSQSRTRAEPSPPTSGGTAPLKPRVRSQSISPHPSANVLSPPPVTGSKFVDPLVLRRQETASKHDKLAMPRPLSGKIPIGQLVKFFDGDAKK
ncbi:hypothetical protein GYMLUDRAFT_245092 [Collybiopsis luxurians FD-317 M1]|uniref:Uncharacterized protein n=1 Tax=Collybiopsis luxurians FD-317 M1 TaxID=944289 RepID=A0A0D0CBN7_9AGAR|nr:hypothetical protein GYMLUDRAFT_245092 [Collybiopsis luxurians FD-317 M1]